MATLDVSEVLTDPLFTSEIQLISTEEGRDENGNPEWIETNHGTFNAVVTADQRTLERLPEALRQTGTILVRVMAETIPPAFIGANQDVIVYHGKRYLIKDTVDYAQFGRGFYRFICLPERLTPNEN